MKLSCLVCFIYIYCSLNIQAQWTNQNLVPEGNHLWSTFFIDDNIGWIVGSDGFIKKTTDGGIEWLQQNSNTTLTLKSVYFVDPYNGWICGEEGLIIKTSNGGESWLVTNSGITDHLTDIFFSEDSIGYAVGFNETILKTSNAGSNWFKQRSGLNFDLFSVDFVDHHTGFAVGGRDSSIFLKTINGGKNWTMETLLLEERPFSPILNCVEFVNSRVGWIGSARDSYNGARISMTTDGGESWFLTSISDSFLKSDTQHNIHENENFVDVQSGIRDIFFRDQYNGFAVAGTSDGWRRSIYSTTDGGYTWETEYFYMEQTGLLSVSVNSNSAGLAVGYNGVIYKTDNNGNWTQILSGNQSGYTGDWIQSVYMIDENLGWAAGYRKGTWYYPIILRTTNGGKIWETKVEFGNSISLTPTNIFFLNENIGWVSYYDRKSYQTTDGGESWYKCDYGGTEKFFINRDTGWNAYEPIGIFKTTNGGQNWVKKSAINSRSIYFSDNLTGWAVGTEGNISKSVDAGENWSLQSSGTSANLNSVRFYNGQSGVCVGDSGTVLVSTDSGDNWISKNIGGFPNLKSVSFVNQNSIWIAGHDGTILHSADLGNSWVTYAGITNVNLESVSFINPNNGWFGGSNGTILKYQDDVIPVELVSFTANVFDNRIMLQWQTATEVNNLGFDIERSIDNSEWKSIGFVNGSGSSISLVSYKFIDEQINAGVAYSYRLKQIDMDGSYKYSDIVEVDFSPSDFILYQNYPNPFNPSTKIAYQIPIETNVSIKVYNLIGEEIITLVNENKKPGRFELEINADNLASGAYIYKIVAGEFVDVKKMLLLK